MKIMIDKGALMPVRKHTDDAGLDLASPVSTVVPAHGACIIDTGVHVQLAKKTFGAIRSRSGLHIKHGIVTDGTIDAGYTGSIVVRLNNLSGVDYKINRGDRIAQLVIIPCMLPKLEAVESFEDTERGDNGFGSSGR